MRQQLAEQLAVSRSLTRKVQDNESSDDEAADEMVPDISLSQDPMNPWMMKRSDKSNVNAEFDFGYKKFVQNKRKLKDDSDSDSNDENMEDESKNELSVLKASINKLSQGVSQIEETGENIEEVTNVKEIATAHVDTEKLTKSKTKQKKEINSSVPKQKPLQNKKKAVVKSKKPVATSNWAVETIDNAGTHTKEEIESAYENHDLSVEKKVEKKLKQLRLDIERLEKARTEKTHTEKTHTKRKPKETKEKDNLESLKLKPKKVKAVIDEELIETSSRTVNENKDNETETTSLSKILNTAQSVAQDSTNADIDPTRFIEVKPKYLNTAVSQGENDYDQLDDDEQVVPKVNIEEVFEEDDVVASFRQEKEEEINKDKPEEINLSLPGWGEWGGKGVKPQKRKSNRFISKPAPKMPRRDENKGDIIIKEYKDPKLAVHKVKDIPFPFESVKDYEASIRAPLGNTFIPERAHKKLIRPSVITKAGTIIEPMDEEELLSAKNRSFKNEAIIKLLGQK